MILGELWMSSYVFAQLHLLIPARVSPPSSLYHAFFRSGDDYADQFLLCNIHRAINGILAMREFKDRFGANCPGVSSDTEICPQDTSIIVSILSVGTVVGSLAAAPVGDYFGRRRSLVWSIGIFCIGAITQVCARVLSTLLAGR